MNLDLSESVIVCLVVSCRGIAIESEILFRTNLFACVRVQVPSVQRKPSLFSKNSSPSFQNLN